MTRYIHFTGDLLVESQGGLVLVEQPRAFDRYPGGKVPMCLPAQTADAKS